MVRLQEKWRKKRSANKALERLKVQEHLSKATYLDLKSKDQAIARFYGLSKVYKPNCTLSPIVALGTRDGRHGPLGGKKVEAFGERLDHNIKLPRPIP